MFFDSFECKKCYEALVLEKKKVVFIKKKQLTKPYITGNKHSEHHNKSYAWSQLK